MCAKELPIDKVIKLKKTLLEPSTQVKSHLVKKNSLLPNFLTTHGLYTLTSCSAIAPHGFSGSTALH